MGKREEQIASHPIWASMAALGKSIDGAVAQADVDAGSVEDIERIRAVLELIGKRLSMAERRLLSPETLNSLDAAIARAIPELQAYASDRVPSHIVGANEAADSALMYLGEIPYTNTSEDLQALSAAANNYHTTIQKGLDGIGTRVSELEAGITTERGRLSEMANTLAEERSKLTQIVAEYQGQFSAAQDTRGRDFNEAQRARAAEFQGVLAEHTRRLTDQDAEFTKARDEAVRRFDSDATSLKLEHQVRASGILDRILVHEKDVVNLVGVIANRGVATGYLQAATEAQKSRRLWQSVTVASMLVLIGFVGFAFLPELNKGSGAFSWAAFAARVFISLSVGVLATYCGFQADRQYKSELRNRKLAIELAAVGPFIASLPTQTRESFLLQLADRSFGREESHAPAAGDRSPSSVMDIFRAFGESDELKKAITSVLAAKKAP